MVGRKKKSKDYFVACGNYMKWFYWATAMLTRILGYYLRLLSRYNGGAPSVVVTRIKGPAKPTVLNYLAF